MYYHPLIINNSINIIYTNIYDIITLKYMQVNSLFVNTKRFIIKTIGTSNIEDYIPKLLMCIGTYQSHRLSLAVYSVPSTFSLCLFF